MLLAILFVGHHEGGWKTADDSLRSNYLLHLLNDIEMADRERRLRLLRSILYLCQGESIS